MAAVQASRRAVLILTASAVIQAAVAMTPDSMGDLLTVRVWTRTLAGEGLAFAYWPPPDPPRLHLPVDYPPLFPYLLWAVGGGLGAVAPDQLARNDRLLDFLIRVPLGLSLLLLGILLRSEARRLAPRQADLVLALVVLNPALLFDTAYWGQADSLCALPAAAALVALARGRTHWSCAAIAAAALVKPLAYPLAPLIVLATLRRHGPRRALTGIAAAAATVIVVLLPFAWIGRGGDVVRALVVQLDAMPYASVNAHNVWWLLTGGLPWTEVSTRIAGGVSIETLALVLFGGFYLFVLRRLWRSADPLAPYVAAASTLAGFFMLSTHMHENHLALAVPAMMLAGLGSPRARVCAVLLSLTLLANMALHDPLLTHVVRPHVPGPRLLRPQQAGVPADLYEHLQAHGYAAVVEQIRGETSLVGLAATFANALANVLIFGAWLRLAYGAPRRE